MTDAHSGAGEPRPIGYWLRALDRLIDEAFDETITEHGVTRRQWQLLSVLDRRSASLAELDHAVAPFLADDPDDPESSAEHLAELVESGWLVLDGDVYALTATGASAFERLRLVVDAQRARLADGLTEEQYAQTVASLERMARNLGWSD